MLEKLNQTRSKIIDSYISSINCTSSTNYSQLKLINFGTGSGKTYQYFNAVYQTIESHPKEKIIGIYIAPLREHLQVSGNLRKNYPDIPVLTLYGRETLSSEDFIDKYKKWLIEIKSDVAFKNKLKEEAKEVIDEFKETLKIAINSIDRFRLISNFFIEENDLKNEIEKASKKVITAIENFLNKIIRSQVQEKDYPKGINELIQIFFPLYVVKENSGILLLTYSKFTTRIPYYVYKKTKWVRRNKYLGEYINDELNSNKKFILALDEIEDGYQIMLDKLIDKISPEELAINNVLSSISRELSGLFLKNSQANRAFFDFIKRNPEAYDVFLKHSETKKIIVKEISSFSADFERLVYQQGNSVHFLRQVQKIYEGLEDACRQINEAFKSIEGGNTEIINLDILARVFSSFERNRSILIPSELYSRISQDLVNIFTYNNLYIYNIESLRKLFLSKTENGHLFITEQRKKNTASLADLIYTIFATRIQINKVKKLLQNVLFAEDSQSRSLDIWSKQVERATRDFKDAAINEKHETYLNRAYVYDSYKSITNILEINRYQNIQNNLIYSDLTEVSIGNTAIKKSPENNLLYLLQNPSSTVFLISATGGISKDLSTCFDNYHLEDQLRDKDGESRFYPMDEKEIELSEEIRANRLDFRSIKTGFFADNIQTFPNQTTSVISSRFEDTLLDSFIYGMKKPYFSRYKIKELKNFTRFLFYLLESDSKDMIAFTQTLQWIAKLLDYCDLKKHNQFKFEKSEKHPNIYYFSVAHKKYQSSNTIKIILYDAKFNLKYYENSGVKQSYEGELTQKEGQKIFFVSAYRSAARGLNPIIKIGENTERDFDALVLLMDSFYSVMKPQKDEKEKNQKGTVKVHYSIMKSLVQRSDNSIEIRKFGQYLTKQEASDYQQEQHIILLGKETLQAIGRIERRNHPNQKIQIFINEETRRNLVRFYNILEQEEPNEIRKFSVNNFAVYQGVKIEQERRTIPNYEEHIFTEIFATRSFNGSRESLLTRIANYHRDKKDKTIVETWERLRDSMVFSNPKTYLENLANSGLYEQEFINSLFYEANDESFIPHLAEEKYEGKSYQIISDNTNGKKSYPYQQRLYPDFLKTSIRNDYGEDIQAILVHPSTEKISRLYRKLIPKPEIFNKLIPRPAFFYDVFYPALSEKFTEYWITQHYFNAKDWKTIKHRYGISQISDFKKYHKLFECFDLYYHMDETLYCIDVKAWSRVSGKKLSNSTVSKTKHKLKQISKDYPQFTNVKGLLLNLYAAEAKNSEHTSNLWSGNLIYKDTNQRPVISSILKDFFNNK